MNLAARAGRWSAAHWKTAFVAWLCLAALFFFLGRSLGTVKLADADTGSGETARAQSILKHANFTQKATEAVLVQSRTLTIDAPAFRQTVRDVQTRLRRFPVIDLIRSPLDPTLHGLVSKDRHSALVQFEMREVSQVARNHVQPILDAVAAEQETHSGYTIEEFGVASSTRVLNKTVGDDFHKAEELTVPITLLILLFAFGAFVAALLPVGLAFTGFLGALGVSAVVSHLQASSDATQSVILLMGMAVGVDYSLFYLRREREERRRGRSPREALRITAATSGHAVLVSGLTVLIAMAGMLLAGNPVFTSIGIGAMIMIAVAIVGSLTILPALLSKLEDRVDRGRIPFVARRLARTNGESRFWSAVISRVTRRPVVSLVAASALLLALATPALGMHTRLLSYTDLPQSLPVIKAYDDIQKAFPGAQTPAEIVIKARDARAPAIVAAGERLVRQALATPYFKLPVHASISPDHTVARIDIPLVGNGTDASSDHALALLRGTLIPGTLGKLPGVTPAVTGITAGTKDFNDRMKARAPVIFAFVLGLAFVLLLLTFRSIVIPIKAILLNLISVFASYGALVLVFQHHWAEGILGFHSNGAVVSWLPMFLFVVLFALSMDYHIFILTRVKELVDRGMPTDEAVERAVKGTAGTVTSAAVVMVAVFAVFATLRSLDIKQMGVGLAVAIFLDATIVRAVLLPAAMKLLGDWNWYLPRWLRWLPSLQRDVAGRDGDPVDEQPPVPVEAPRDAVAAVD
ncbi:MAG TPA: MMPL family transporter [Gaiellaceae bacterium]|nr:MMPL family transporter [Gaiellaceae bacterium]